MPSSPSSAGSGRESDVKLLLVSSSGGHLAQLMALEPWWSQHDRMWVVGPTEDARRIILEQDSFTTVKDEYYQQDRSMAWLLVTVIVALLVVTALGIVGLASFWVQQRTKQIGVRRALGATRGQVLRYFQTENFLLATVGIAIGMIGAYGINQLLMSSYELPRLPALYLPVGALVLWTLGQLSVLGPARRAAAVPPAVATRTV